VIQEIALANQSTATVICGQDTISWAEFSEAVSLFDGALTGPLDLSKLKFPHRNNVSYSTRYAPALGAIRLVLRRDPFRSAKFGISCFHFHHVRDLGTARRDILSLVDFQ